MYCDFDALERTTLQRDPFDYIVTPEFIKPETLAALIGDYPDVPGPGSHPPSELRIDGHFKALLEELKGPPFRAAIERKFDIDLSGRPWMCTVRGFARASDGAIHTDSATKLITVLIYMNERWEPDGGRLRLLRSANDLDDYALEAPPHGGALLAFRRSETSWHGHKPFVGRRRAIQINWVTSDAVANGEQRRHRISTRVKKLKNLFFKVSGAQAAFERAGRDGRGASNGAISRLAGPPLGAANT